MRCLSDRDLFEKWQNRVRCEEVCRPDHNAVSSVRRWVPPKTLYGDGMRTAVCPVRCALLIFRV